MAPLSTLPSIKLVNGTLKEQRLREVLSNLLIQYPLSKWQYTDSVQIEEGTLPHSHPVLTLSPQTRLVDYLADAKQLLGTYIHEQLHWFLLLDEKVENSREVSSKLHKRYPNLPLERPRGCGSEFSNDLHLQVNYLEYLGLSELLGVSAAKQQLGRIPYYTDIYALVLEKNEEIGEVMTKYDLIPSEQPPETKRFIQV